MRKFLYLTFVLVLFVLGACSNNDEDTSADNSEEGSKETVSVENSYTMKTENDNTEDVTETVEVPVNPENVVVYDFSALSTIKELGVEDSVTGVAKSGNAESYFPESLQEFNTDDYQDVGTLKEPNFEAVASIQPDVIMISGRQATNDIIAEFEKAAPNAVILFTAPNTENYFSEVQSKIELLGQVYDKEDEASSLVENVNSKIEEIKNLADSTEHTSLFVMANEGELSVYGPGGRYGFLYDELDLPAADEDIEPEGHGQVISYEYINSVNPEIIFVMDRAAALGGEESAEKELSNDVIKEVDAIKNDRVTHLNPKIWYLSYGGAGTTIEQLDEIKSALE